MRISMTTNSSAQSASELIACLKVGRAREFPIRKFCGAGSSALTRSTHLFDEYERRWRHARPAFARWLRRGGSTSCAVVWRSVSVLVEARVHFVWRTDWSDRDDARRTRREKTLDRQCQVSARAKFLHVAARPGSATACHLHRLAPAQDARRRLCRRSLCYSINLFSLGAQLRLCRVWKHSMDRGDLLRTETGGPCHCRRGGHPDWKQGAQERGHVVARLGCICRNLFFSRAISFNHH